MRERTREPNVRGSGSQLREQLVAAASELLLRPQTISLPSLRAVARACSVSPAAVYLHFPSSAALMAAVLDEQLAALSEHMRALATGAPSAAAALEQFATAYVSWGLAHPGAYQLLFETADRLAAEADLTHDNWDLMHETVALVVALRGGRPGQAVREEDQQLGFRLWAALHGIVSLRLHKPDAAWPQPVADQVAATVRDLTAQCETGRPARPELGSGRPGDLGE